MIKIKKLNLPDEVREKMEELARQLQDYVDREEAPPKSLVNKYNDSKLKATLIEETHGKCAFCESDILAVYYADIEHIRPKSIYPQLACTWENLTLACAWCNNNKRDYDNPDLPVVHPYNDDPRHHIRYSGIDIDKGRSTFRGQKTWSLVKLDREELKKRRRSKHDSIGNLYWRWRQTVDMQERNACVYVLWDETQPDKEYSSMVMDYLYANNVPNP